MPRSRASDSPERAEAALRVIIFYKVTRGALALAASAVLAAFAFGRGAASLTGLARGLRDHVTSGWTVALADALLGLVAPGRLWIVVAALAADGAMTCFEGFSLHRRWWWAPWLVVAITLTFVPFEVVRLARHLAIGRVLLLVANLLVAVYLVYLARRHPLARAPRRRAAIFARASASSSRHGKSLP